MSSSEVDLDYAHALARQALSLMESHRIRLSAENFELWLMYASKQSLELVKLIDVLVSNGGRFDEQICSELVRLYVAKVPHEVPKVLLSVLDEARALMTTAIADQRSQVETLD